MSLEKVALFDLDGTLVDYDSAMRRDLLALANLPDELSLPLHWVKDMPEIVRLRMKEIKMRDS